ncbi:hypothetical protein [Gimesia panareensis]|nr:hypothetical protein [Gimesia panareensis]
MDSVPHADELMKWDPRVGQTCMPARLTTSHRITPPSKTTTSVEKPG